MDFIFCVPISVTNFYRNFAIALRLDGVRRIESRDVMLFDCDIQTSVLNCQAINDGSDLSCQEKNFLT